MLSCRVLYSGRLWRAGAAGKDEEMHHSFPVREAARKLPGYQLNLTIVYSELSSVYTSL